MIYHDRVERVLDTDGCCHDRGIGGSSESEIKRFLTFKPADATIFGLTTIFDMVGSVPLFTIHECCGFELNFLSGICSLIVIIFIKSKHVLKLNCKK